MSHLMRRNEPLNLSFADFALITFSLASNPFSLTTDCILKTNIFNLNSVPRDCPSSLLCDESHWKKHIPPCELIQTYFIRNLRFKFDFVIMSHVFWEKHERYCEDYQKTSVDEKRHPPTSDKGWV